MKSPLFTLVLAMGLGIPMGRHDVGWMPMLLVSVALATIHLWRTRAALRVAQDDAGTIGSGALFGTAMIWVALSVIAFLAVLLGAYIGGFFPSR